MTHSKTLELPFGLPGLNEILAAAKKSPYQYAAMKKKYTQRISEELLVQGCRPVSPYKRIWLTITWFESKKKRDPDNVRAGVKFLLDAMVASGVIEDDGIENIDSLSDAFEQGDKRAVQAVWGES